MMTIIMMTTQAQGTRITKTQFLTSFFSDIATVGGTIRSETREAWNKNGMDAGGVLFFLVARAVCACIYVMVLLLLLC